VNCVDRNIQGQCVYHFPSSENRTSENFDSRDVELRTQEWELSEYLPCKKAPALVTTTQVFSLALGALPVLERCFHGGWKALRRCCQCQCSDTDPASLQSLQEFSTFDGSKGGNMVHLETMDAIKLALRTPDDRPIRGKTLVRFPASRVQEAGSQTCCTYLSTFYCCHIHHVISIFNPSVVEFDLFQHFSIIT
jgi:hypothetical protein